MKTTLLYLDRENTPKLIFDSDKISLSDSDKITEVNEKDFILYSLPQNDKSYLMTIKYESGIIPFLIEMENEIDADFISKSKFRNLIMDHNGIKIIPFKLYKNGEPCECRINNEKSDITFYYT